MTIKEENEAQYWKGWPDFLGYDHTPDWNTNRVKELLRDWIKSRIIYTCDDAELYAILSTKGILNLTGNKHNQLLRNMIKKRHTEEGKAAIEEYANSDSDIIPEILRDNKHEEDEDTIGIASTEEIAEILDVDRQQQQTEENITAKDILRNSQSLESISVDIEIMKFLLLSRINKLWKLVFKEKEKEKGRTFEDVKSEGLNGNKFHDEVAVTFLSEYEKSMNLKIPDGYNFKVNGEIAAPTLMQLYTAYKIKTNPYFCNFSGTGSGKTLSAVLASRIINSKLTVVVCPLPVVEQWKDTIKEIFPDSNVITDKEQAFYYKQQDNKNKKYNYLILNYDKFSQDDSPDLIITLVTNNKIDFIVFDEIQFIKQRYDTSEKATSQRLKNLKGLLTYIRQKNQDVKVLGLTATPLINNLKEGRYLLDLVTGKVHDDISTRATILNAETLYQKLSLISIRYKTIEDNKGIDTHTIEVSTQKPYNIKHLVHNPLYAEQVLTPLRIPEILKNIKNQTIIYTEYVTEVIQQLSNAVRNAGYTFATFTGRDINRENGLNKFLNNEVQVLIASKPISVGVDKLQRVCNRLIFNTLPWTSVGFEQTVGRLHRLGQNETFGNIVDVFIIKATVNDLLNKPYKYDEIQKWNKIEYKRTLVNCAVDGIYPEKNLPKIPKITAEEMDPVSKEWLNRLELENKMSYVNRENVNVELTPTQIQKRLVTYGDFAKQNRKFNTENSDTTHKRLEDNPEELFEYHRKLDINRKTWSIDPLTEVISILGRMSSRFRIADFGCGIKTRIAEELGKEREVISFDHISMGNNKIIPCDIRSVKDYIKDSDLEVAVFSLSLMGKNWRDYIAEAKRCLCVRGTLLIVVTTKELNERLKDLRNVIKQNGFKIYLDDSTKGIFTIIEATKL